MSQPNPPIESQPLDPNIEAMVDRLVLNALAAAEAEKDTESLHAEEEEEEEQEKSSTPPATEDAPVEQAPAEAEKEPVVEQAPPADEQEEEQEQPPAEQSESAASGDASESDGVWASGGWYPNLLAAAMALGMSEDSIRARVASTDPEFGSFRWGPLQ